MSRLPRATLVAIALLAGCATPSSTLDDASAPLASTLLDPTLADGLPCEADMRWDAATDNLRELASDPLTAIQENWRGEFDIHDAGERTLLAAGRSAGVGGFDLYDITDPTAPIPLAGWDGSEYGFQDLKFTPDGTAIVHAGYDTLALVDIRTPGAPVLEVEHVLEAEGAHMVATWTVDGRDHVSISKAEGKDVSIFALRGEPGARSFERLATPTMNPVGDYPRDEPVVLFNTRSHDTWFEFDPEIGMPILWVANVFWGVAALDVTDPAAPKLLTRIPHADPYAGYTHSAQVAHLDGKRYVVATTEYVFGGVKVWDATDLAAPTLVADWRMDVPTLPAHNLQVVGQHAFVAHFYEGLLVFDLAQLDGSGTPLAPQRIAPVAHVPPQGAPTPRVPVSPGQDYYGALDVAVEDGIVWVSEGAYGVRSFAFGCLTPGDEAASAWG
jgi:hypothetical protein